MKNLGTQRLLGLDLLRIVAMLMIVMTHVLGKGGLRDAVDPSWNWHYVIVWTFQIASYVAVNCYGILSGYVGIDHQPKWSRLASFWLQVAFYTIGITCIFALVGYQLTPQQWVGAFFPVVTSQYWYVSAYIGLLVFKPLLNKGISALSDRQLEMMLAIAYLVFCLSPALFNNKVLEYSLSKGFGMTWLIILYVIGAYLKRHRLDSLKNASLVGIYLLMSLVTYLGMIGIGEIWFWYPSPSLILASLALFILFTRIRWSGGKTMTTGLLFFSQSSFGVYLIHLHPLVEKYFIKEGFLTLLNLPDWLFPISLLLITLGIYLLSSLIEGIRISLFRSLRLDALVGRLDHYFDD